MPQPIVELLVLVALTALVTRSYLRYVREPGPVTTPGGSLTRPVILVGGGIVCLSFVLALVRKLAELMR